MSPNRDIRPPAILAGHVRKIMAKGGGDMFLLKKSEVYVSKSRDRHPARLAGFERKMVGVAIK